VRAAIHSIDRPRTAHGDESVGNITRLPISEDVAPAPRRLRSLTQITCLGCGKQALGQRNKRYCTVACARLAWARNQRQQQPPKRRGQHQGTCERCGTGLLGYRTKRFCSRVCSLAAYREAHLEDSRRWTADYRNRYPDRVQQQNRAAYPRRKSYQQDWRKQNLERVREYSRKHRSLNPERRNEDKRRSYRKHAEKRRAENARWRKDNPDRHAFINAARRARLMAAPGSHTYQDWLDLVQKFDGKCAYCGLKTEHLTRDHINPLKRGGGNEIANILPACRPCNARKGFTPLDVFKARLRKELGE